MIKKDFIYEVIDRGRNRVGDTCELLIKTTPRNNGQHLTGIVFKKKEGVSPLVYLDKYYDQYVSDGMNMVEIVDEIARIQEDGGIQEMIGSGCLTDYEAVQSKIRLKLINYEANQARLETMPYIPFLDTAIVFYIEIDSDSMKLLTAAVEHHHLEIWGVGKERIYEDALCNMRTCYPVSIRPMMSVMEDFAERMGGGLDISMLRESIPRDRGFWVMTTETGLQGAATLLYGDGLKQFAELDGDDIVILPSSRHEVLLIPQRQVNGKYESFSHMVEMVNETEVSMEDRLSNSVYLYSREKDSITIAHRGPSL